MTSLPHPVVRWNIFPESSGLLRSLQERGDNANITETSEVYDDVSFYKSLLNLLAYIISLLVAYFSFYNDYNKY